MILPHQIVDVDVGAVGRKPESDAPVSGAPAQTIAEDRAFRGKKAQPASPSSKSSSSRPRHRLLPWARRSAFPSSTCS